MRQERCDGVLDRHADRAEFVPTARFPAFRASSATSIKILLRCGSASISGRSGAPDGNTIPSTSLPKATSVPRTRAKAVRLLAVEALALRKLPYEVATAARPAPKTSNSGRAKSAANGVGFRRDGSPPRRSALLADDGASRWISHDCQRAGDADHRDADQEEDHARRARVLSDRAPTAFRPRLRRPAPLPRIRPRRSQSRAASALRPSSARCGGRRRRLPRPPASRTSRRTAT